MGTEYISSKGKIYGLDSTHAGTGSGWIHKRYAWYDSGSGISSVLSLYHAGWPGKFKRFAINVWNIDPEGKNDTQIAEEGLSAMESWMKEIGLVMNITELGADESMIEGIADVTIVLPGGYKVLNRDEIVKILRESL